MSKNTRSRFVILKSWLQETDGAPIDTVELKRCLTRDTAVAPYFSLHARMLYGKLLSLSGKPLEAIPVLEGAFRLASEEGNRFFALSATHQTAYCLIESGERARAEDMCRRLAEQLGEDEPALRSFGKMIYVPLAVCRYLVDDLEGAEHWIELALHSGEVKAYEHYILYDGSNIASLVKLARGDLAGARAVAVGVGRDLLDAEIALSSNRIDDAARIIAPAKTGDVCYSLHPSRRRGIVYLRYLAASGLVKELTDLADACVAVAEEQGRILALIILKIYQALAAHLRNEEVLALSYLGEACELAEPGDYRRPFIDEGPIVALLLGKLKGTGHGIIRRILAAKIDRGADANPVASGKVSGVDQLSRRELDVIRLVAEGKSNQEIADMLFISLGTVKWHVNNIFSKLAVANRTSAINRARDLGLIPQNPD